MKTAAIDIQSVQLQVNSGQIGLRTLAATSQRRLPCVEVHDTETAAHPQSVPVRQDCGDAAKTHRTAAHATARGSIKHQLRGGNLADPDGEHTRSRRWFAQFQAQRQAGLGALVKGRRQCGVQTNQIRIETNRRIGLARAEASAPERFALHKRQCRMLAARPQPLGTERAGHAAGDTTVALICRFKRQRIAK